MIGAVSLGLSARLNARFGERDVLLAGLALLAAALGLLTRLPVHADYAVHLLPTMLLAGGFGLAISALTTLGMSERGHRTTPGSSPACSTPPSRSAARSASPCCPRWRPRTPRALLGAGHSDASALTGGFHLAFAIGTGLVAAAFVLAATLLRRRTPLEPV